MHPRLAQALKLEDNQWITVSTRRGSLTLRTSVVQTIRPDTVFIPYHWGGKQSANLLTNRALDPVSKIPEFKISACAIRAASQAEMLEGQRAEIDASREIGVHAEYGLEQRRTELSR